MDGKLGWALHLAAQGFLVFPLRPNTKHPLIDKWPEKATTDEAQIRQWWQLCPDANIGIHCDGIGVVDLDVKNGKDGVANWLAADRLSLHGAVFRTPTGGYHLVFFDPDRTFRNTAGKIGDGIDTRGKGGYIVGPGSTIDGIPYTISSYPEMAVRAVPRTGDTPDAQCRKW